MILIVGAGPTGLGAAWRLHERGETDWLLVDSNNYAGGLAASYRDSYGFLWDFAIHVAHSHYTYFDNLMKTLLPDGFYQHQRKAWVRLYDSWVPYPFQYNFHRLPEHQRRECMQGIEDLRIGKKAPEDFKQWIRQSFGEGIAEHFMLPYNEKIWSTNTEQMGTAWLGERVPQINAKEIRELYDKGKDKLGWGPNAVFNFPKKGGTGAIWAEMLSRLPKENVRLGTKLLFVNTRNRTATLSGPHDIHYDSMISTVPISELARMANNDVWLRASGELRHTHTQVVGVGLQCPLPDELRDKTWVYCPEDKSAFYRVTPFSSLSPDHVPEPENQCSFLCEISSPGDKPMPRPYLPHLAEKGLRDTGIIDVEGKQPHYYLMEANYGYPVPTVNRDDILHTLLPAMQHEGIYSRGRFGGWKYEVSNMDHSVMQGVEAVDSILDGTQEITIYEPNKINGQ